MRRADFLKLTDIEIENFKGYMRRGVLPFLEMQDEAGERKWTEYSTRDVVETCLAMALVDAGMEMQHASGSVVRLDRDAVRLCWESIINDATPIWLGVVRFSQPGKPAPTKARQVSMTVVRSASFIGPLSHLFKLKTSAGVPVEQMPGASDMVLINASRVVTAIRQRAAEHGIEIDLANVYQPN
jgi:hypothetical protein